MRALRASIAVTSLCVLFFPAIASGDTPWVGPPGAPSVDPYFLLKTEPGVRLNEGDRSSGWWTTGIDEIDALDQSYDVIAVHRVHVDPPRGRRNPQLFSELGLDRIYRLTLHDPQTDIASVAAAYEALDTVEKA